MTDNDNNHGVLASVEGALRQRLEAIDGDLERAVRDRDQAQRAVADLRQEQHHVKIALGGFDRVKNPRRRRASAPVTAKKERA